MNKAVQPVQMSGLWNCCKDRECLIGMPLVAAITSLMNESELWMVVPPKRHL